MTIDRYGRRVRRSAIAANLFAIFAVTMLVVFVATVGASAGYRFGLRSQAADCMTPHEARLLTTWMADTLRVELPRRIERVRIVADSLESWLPDASAEERRLMVDALTMGGVE